MTTMILQAYYILHEIFCTLNVQNTNLILSALFYFSSTYRKISNILSDIGIHDILQKIFWLLPSVQLCTRRQLKSKGSGSIVIEAPFVLITAILRRQRRAQFLTDPYTLSRAQESYHFSWHWKLTDVHPVDPNVQYRS